MKDVHGGRNVDESRFARDTRRRRFGPWVRTLAGTCLAAITVGGPAMVAGGIAAGASAVIFAPAASGPCSFLSAKAAAVELCLMAVAGGKQGAPAGLTATAGNAQVTLSWAAPASDGGAPVTGYNVYAGTTADFTGGAKVAGITGTAVVLVGLVNGTPYYFRVTAVNAAGNESPFSTEVSAKPARPARGVAVSLTSPTPPKQLIALLAAVAVIAAAGAFTLIARRRRRFPSRKLARSARSRQQMAVASDVRAVPDTSRPDVMAVRDTGPEPIHTVRLEPHPGVTTTTIKEGRP